MAGDRKAWVGLPSEETVRALLGAKHQYDFGFLPGMVRLVLAHPGVGPFLGALFQRVMFGEGVLTRSEREMVAAVASAAQDCRY
jgi:hypothetical protein